MASIQELLFGPPTSGSNDPDISQFLANADKEAWQANQERLIAERKYLTDEEMEGMTDKEAFHINYNFPDSLVGMGKEEGLTDLRNDPSMQGLLKFNYTDPDATSTAHANIDEILADNKAQTAFDIGTIGPTPYQETDEFQQKAFDIAQGLAVPGAAIGKIAKARLTGGHMARTGSNYWDEMVKWKDKDVVNQIKNINSLNKAKILVEKAFNKWGIKPQNARGMKDSYERQLMDPVSEILRTSKYKQN